MGGKGRRGGTIPGFARGRGSAAFRDPNAIVDPSAVTCGENPAGVFVHRGGLYISESVDNRVICVKDNITTVVAGGNGKGRRPDQFDRPFRIFVNDDGIFVADRNNARVQFWRHGACTGETVAGGNGPGHGAHQLNQPTAVAVEGNDFYIADRGNHRIMRWTSGAQEGVLVAGGNGFGQGADQLGCPSSVRVLDSALFISDESGGRVQRWVPFAKEGVTVAGGRGNGAGPLQLYHPLALAFMDSTLLVCDATNHRVQQWALEAGHSSTVRTVCGGFGIGSEGGQLGHCMDCFWDGEYLYVSDWYHACVRKYTRETLNSHAEKAEKQQEETWCDGKRYTGQVVEWRDHGGYGFIIDDLTGKRFMAHNSDIANSLVQFGYAVLTEGERVEYSLLCDVVGKWKCDAVTAEGGGPVSPDEQIIDMSINSGHRQKAQKLGGKDGSSHFQTHSTTESITPVSRWSRKNEEQNGKGAARRRWRPTEKATGGA